MRGRVAPRLLPAGPWREPLRSARRANLLIITRKTAERSTVENVTRALANAAPRVPVAVAYLAPGDLRSTATGQTLPLHVLRGADLTAIAAIAHPDSFFRQLTELGAVVRPHSFPRPSLVHASGSTRSGSAREQLRFRRLHSQGRSETGVPMACRSGVIMVCFTALANRGRTGAHRPSARQSRAAGALTQDSPTRLITRTHGH